MTNRGLFVKPTYVSDTLTKYSTVISDPRRESLYRLYYKPEYQYPEMTLCSIETKNFSEIFTCERKIDFANCVVLGMRTRRKVLEKYYKILHLDYGISTEVFPII